MTRKTITTSELDNCVRLAAKIVSKQMPRLEQAMRPVAFAMMLRELLDNEYVDDIEDEQPWQ